MKNDEIANAYDSILPDDGAKDRVLNRIRQKQGRGHPVSRLAARVPAAAAAVAAVAAAAAVICLIVVGYMYLSPAQPQDAGNPVAVMADMKNQPTDAISQPFGNETHNAFTFLAYAASLPDTGSDDQKEFNAGNRPDNVLAHYEREHSRFLVGLGLRCGGENIRNIEISVGEGYFAKLKPVLITPSDGPITPSDGPIYIGIDRLTIFDNFEAIGSSVTFGDDSVSTINIDMMFWVLEGVDFSSLPEEVEIRAKVTFLDGATQESVSLIDLTDVVYITEWASLENQQLRQELYEMHDFYLNIPLEECELVPYSMQVVADVYVYELGSDSHEATIFPMTFDLAVDGLYRTGRGEPEFDEYGVCRIAFGDDAGDGDSRGYLVVIKRDESGTMTGMVYRTPKRVA